VGELHAAGIFTDLIVGAASTAAFAGTDLTNVCNVGASDRFSAHSRIRVCGSVFFAKSVANDESHCHP
jgi:hypothetical protein